jgi:hypothetical protein
MKFSTGDNYKNLPGDFQFLNIGKSYTLLQGVNKFPILPAIFTSDLFLKFKGRYLHIMLFIIRDLGGKRKEKNALLSLWT